MARLKAILVVLAWLYAARAHAFSDPLSFSDAVQLGGGGGRHFTGSVADGYGCNVCHAGAEPPRIEVFGLPTRGFIAGASYEVTVAWPASVEHVGLALEITDERGMAAGQLRLPPLHELPDAERCEPAIDGVHAGVLQESSGRTVLHVPDCGARRVRFLWTVPEAAPDLVLFAGGFVAADGDATVERDGVTTFSRPLSRTGEPPVTTLRGSCAAGGTGTGAVAPALIALLIAARRRRART